MHNQLERDRGFLIYASQAYPLMVPYLKGIHLTGRRPGTVNKNLATMQRIVRVHENVHGIKCGFMFRPQGPHPAVYDTFGMMTAAALIECSLNAGVNEATTLFNTIRKTRSALSNYERTTAEENRQAALVGYKKG
jgi:hypothetical protein